MLALLLLAAGCGGGTEIHRQGFIDLETKPEQVTLKAGTVVKDFKYIKIETTNESVIGEIVKIIPSKFGFLILDASNLLTLFDNDGRFINRIGRRGQGPGEYIQIGDADICEETGIVYLLDGGKSEILQYSFENKFLRSIKIDRSVTNFIKASFGFICYMDPLLQVRNYGRPAPALAAVDNEGNVLNILQYRTVNLEKFPPFIHSALMKKYGDRYFYCPPLQDTIFSVYEDKIVPEYVLFKGKYSISVEDVADLEKRRSAYQRGLVVGNFAVNDRWLFVQCKRNNEMELYFYDLKTKKLLNLAGKNNLPAMLNDIDGTFDVFPFVFYNSSIIEVKRADAVLEEQNIPDALKNLAPEDNPVIRISTVIE
ncbi:MAG: 6-bladed beta-propeller [Prevotellaceae bacterium]|nr:6-bladed beta-propeller [Prevotellaceae bacterium]